MQVTGGERQKLLFMNCALRAIAGSLQHRLLPDLQPYEYAQVVLMFLDENLEKPPVGFSDEEIAEIGHKFFVWYSEHCKQ